MCVPSGLNATLVMARVCPREDDGLAGAVDAPDAHGIILTGSNNPQSIPTESGGRHGACIATDYEAVARPIGPPDSHSIVVTAREDVNIIAAKHGTSDDAFMAAKDNGFNSPVRGPYTSRPVSTGCNDMPAVGPELGVKDRSGEFAAVVAVTAQHNRRAEAVSARADAARSFAGSTCL